jgi:hypothetical protein
MAARTTAAKPAPRAENFVTQCCKNHLSRWRRTQFTLVFYEVMINHSWHSVDRETYLRIF